MLIAARLSRCPVADGIISACGRRPLEAEEGDEAEATATSATRITTAKGIQSMVLTRPASGGENDCFGDGARGNVRGGRRPGSQRLSPVRSGSRSGEKTNRPGGGEASGVGGNVS
jgi:hypothetical protein